MGNLISVSSAPIARLGNKEYYDLLGTLEVLRKVHKDSTVDGFELQLEPEWDSERSPLTDAELADWTKITKFTFRQISALVRKERLPILSVHASRDVGGYLCSSRKRDFEKSKNLIFESLSLTENLGAKVCVFHVWDTRKKEFDSEAVREVFLEISRQFSRVKASVENIPTHLRGHTPFTLAEQFDYVTLDLRWAALYDELDRFESIVDKIVNVHLRGRLEGNAWVLNRSSFSFQQALSKIQGKWKYPGLLTVEPEGGTDSSSYDSFIKAMKSLRK